MDLQFVKYAFDLVTWAVSLVVVGMLAGVFIYKFRKGWIALWITMALQLVFAVVFPDVYFHNTYMPGIAAVGAWAFSMVATGLFGLAAYPVAFFIVHGKSQQRLLAGGLTVVAALVSAQLFYDSVAERYGLDLNVDLHGKIIDLDGRPVPYARIHLNYCTRYEANPLSANYDGTFRIRANCPQQIVVTRIVEDGGGRPCLTRTESSLSILGGVAKFVSREANREEPQALYWGAHGKDTPFILTCIWEPARNRKEARGYFRNLLADGQVYTANIDGSRHVKLQLYDDDRRGLFTLQFMVDQADDGSTASGKIVLRGYKGGIQPTDDRVFNLAPENGYLDRAEMDLGDMQTRTTRRFYFHNSDRLGYGMAEIDYRPDAVPPLALDIYAMRSWFGERVLAPPIK